MGKKRIVVVGGGFAGLAAVRKFKDDNLDVVLIDKTNHHLFQPLLYQVATSGLNPSEIASPIRSILRKQKNVTTIMGEVTDVDYENNKVILKDDNLEIPFDYLILAIGGRTTYFGNENWAQFASGLKTLKDALHIRQRVLLSLEKAEKSKDSKEIESLMTIAVIGGGATGVELAGAIAELRRYVLKQDYRNIDPQKVRVILVEGGQKLLSAFDDSLSEYALKQLIEMGVEVSLNEKVSELNEDSIVTDKRTIYTKNTFWAAGVGGHKIATSLSEARDRANKIVVDPDLRISGRENVYAVGDMANYKHSHTFKGNQIPGVAPAAMQQGRVAASNIIRQIKGKKTKKFSYFDKGSMATIGRVAAVCQLPRPLSSVKMTGFIAWIAWLFVHLLYLVDYTNRLYVFLRWTWKYISWKWNVRLITRS